MGSYMDASRLCKLALLCADVQVTAAVLHSAFGTASLALPAPMKSAERGLIFTKDWKSENPCRLLLSRSDLFCHHI